MLSKLDYVLDLGGSIVNPGTLDEEFLLGFQALIKEYIAQGKTFGIIVGGGYITRLYQDFLRSYFEVTNEDLDMIGIRPTKLNAELVRIIFKEYAYPKVVEEPNEQLSQAGEYNVLVFSGWKPGWSTDYVAVLVAKRFGATALLSLSNTKGIYALKDGKPQEGQLIGQLSWQAYEAMIGGQWLPGMKVPFDPVATKQARQNKLKVIALDGRDLSNFKKCLDGQAFVGTTIS